jgi:hypothetical protein
MPARTSRAWPPNGWAGPRDWPAWQPRLDLLPQPGPAPNLEIRIALQDRPQDLQLRQHRPLVAAQPGWPRPGPGRPRPDGGPCWWLPGPTGTVAGACPGPGGARQRPGLRRPPAAGAAGLRSAGDQPPAAGGLHRLGGGFRKCPAAGTWRPSRPRPSPPAPTPWPTWPGPPASTGTWATPPAGRPIGVSIRSTAAPVPPRPPRRA